MELTGQQLDVVRKEVRGLLERTPAYTSLPPDARKAMAQNMVRVASVLSKPDWLSGPPPQDPLQAQALEDAVDKVKKRLAESPGSTGEDFKAGAVQQGTEEFGRLVQKVDFPNFVASLVEGVFQAVVSSSIQQMQAYGELLSAVGKTTDEFARDHMSEGAARDWLAEKYPSHVRVDASSDRARLVPQEGTEDGQNIGPLAGMDREVDLGSPEDEAALVAFARTEMARQRQQLMATMVLLGINRIVVTNGLIHAKVLFDVEASDQMNRTASAELHDAKQKSSSMSAGIGGGLVGAIFGGPRGSISKSSSHRTTVSSAVDDTSESKAKAKAQLSGEVRLSFKSETFPLEKMVDVMGMQTLNSRAGPLPIGQGQGQAPGQPQQPGGAT